MGVVEEFYQDLYVPKLSDMETMPLGLEMLQSMISEEDSDNLEEWNVQQVRVVLGSFREDRMLGEDWLLKEFCTTFWEVVDPDLMKEYGEMRRGKHLIAGMESGVTIPFSKKGEEEALSN